MQPAISSAAASVVAFNGATRPYLYAGGRASLRNVECISHEIP